MDIWVVGTSNELFIRGSWTETKFSKNKVVAGKTPFFEIGPFCNHHSIFLNIGCWYVSFLWNDAFSILVLSTEKRYYSLLKKVFVFQKIWFKVKILKSVKISRDCHIKTCRSLKRRVILKIPSTVFLEESMLFLLASKWNLWEKAFSNVKTKPTQILP